MEGQLESLHYCGCLFATLDCGLCIILVLFVLILEEFFDDSSSRYMDTCVGRKLKLFKQVTAIELFESSSVPLWLATKEYLKSL